MLTSQILNAIDYFSLFKYAPDVNQIHIFIKAKIARQEVETVLGRLVRQKKLVQMKREGVKLASQYYKSFNFLPDVYTRREYQNTFNFQRSTSQNTIQKLEKTRMYIKLLSFFPQIKLIGISGSVAMMNAKEEDDIDLFIVTQKDRLWTGRMIAILLAELLRKRRRYGDKSARDKICLNLFFDEKDLAISAVKRSEYVAHEVMQMKPVVTKGEIYKRFLDANRWVFDIFPNARKKRYNIEHITYHKYMFHVLCYMLYPVTSLLEPILKKSQLQSINRHRTTELITDSQLWFFPDDFEKKMKES